MDEKLFSKERERIERAESVLKEADGNEVISKQEFQNLLSHYEEFVQQTIQMVKVADLISNGLNTMKNNLAERVNLDELTGLYNRRYLMSSITRYIKEAKRNNAPLAVLFIDVDCFKKYNDRYGHMMGDRCLRSVADAMLNSTLRPFDFVSRYGGEEFFILLPYVEECGAMTVANRVLENVRALGIEHKGNTADNIVTVSIGATSYKFDADSEIQPESLIKTSDNAMYRSKSMGRNQATYFPLEIHSCGGGNTDDN